MTYPIETGKRNIPLTKPFFDKEEEKAVISVLRSGWHTQGPQTEAFEVEFSKLVGAKYAVAVSNCTSALHISLLLGGIKEGDEVIVPSFTYIACVNVIRHVFAKPVFVEVDEKTFNIDPRDLKKKISAKTKAIIAVDQVGLPCDIDEINAIAKKQNIFVIEDAACALGSKYKGKMIGGSSRLTCFSLHPRKIVSTGEGGVITTNNQKMAEMAKVLRSHGASLGDHDRHSSSSVTFEKYLSPGYNYRLTDIQSAIGRQQLKKLSKILKKRRILAKRYSEKLSKENSIEIPFTPAYAEPNWQTYIIRLKSNFHMSQKQFMQKLLDHGISTRKGVMASHLEPYYQSLLGRVSLPITENLAKSTIALPLYHQMTTADQNYVIENIIKITHKI